MNDVRLVPNGDEPTWEAGDLFDVITPARGARIFMLAAVDTYVYAFVDLMTGQTLLDPVEVPACDVTHLYSHMVDQFRGFEYTHLGPCRIEVFPEKK